MAPRRNPKFRSYTENFETRFHRWQFPPAITAKQASWQFCVEDKHRLNVDDLSRMLVDQEFLNPNTPTRRYVEEVFHNFFFLTNYLEGADNVRNANIILNNERASLFGIRRQHHTVAICGADTWQKRIKNGKIHIAMNKKKSPGDKKDQPPASEPQPGPSSRPEPIPGPSSATGTSKNPHETMTSQSPKASSSKEAFEQMLRDEGEHICRLSKRLTEILLKNCKNKFTAEELLDTEATNVFMELDSLSTTFLRQDRAEILNVIEKQKVQLYEDGKPVRRWTKNEKGDDVEEDVYVQEEYEVKVNGKTEKRLRDKEEWGFKNKFVDKRQMGLTFYRAEGEAEDEPFNKNRVHKPWFLQCKVVNIQPDITKEPNLYFIPDHYVTSSYFFRTMGIAPVHERYETTFYKVKWNNGCGKAPIIEEHLWEDMYADEVVVEICPSELESIRACESDAEKKVPYGKSGPPEKEDSEEDEDDDEEEKKGDDDAPFKPRGKKQKAAHQSYKQKKAAQKSKGNVKSGKKKCSVAYDPDKLSYYLVPQGTQYTLYPEYEIIAGQPLFPESVMSTDLQHKFDFHGITDRQLQALAPSPFDTPNIAGVTKQHLKKWNAVSCAEKQPATIVLWSNGVRKVITPDDGESGSESEFEDDSEITSSGVTPTKSPKARCRSNSPRSSPGENSCSPKLNDQQVPGSPNLRPRSAPQPVQAPIMPTPERKNSGNKRKAASPLDKDNLSPNSPESPPQVVPQLSTPVKTRTGLFRKGFKASKPTPPLTQAEIQGVTGESPPTPSSRKEDDAGKKKKQAK